MSSVRPLEGLSVLIAEDNYYIADDSRRTLEAAGARVIGPVSSGSDAVLALQTETPDCAVLDLNMDGAPDFEPARAFVAAGVPILIFSGYDAALAPPDLAKAPFLTKAIDEQRLVDAVASACGIGA